MPIPPKAAPPTALNQYTTLNATTLTHDPNGNLQSDGIWTYGHDPDNRLVTAVRNNPASSASLGYDPAGRLNHTNINGTVTDLLYDGTDLIAEYDGTGTLTTRHIHGPGIDEPLVSITGTTKTWRYADHLGSVIAEADAMGNATAIRGYGPFGENGTMVPNRFGYTGQQYIAGLGLYYYKARWYSPTIGRFLETDPIGYADGVNWYAYVNNNPVNTNDPSGLCPICLAVLVETAPEWGAALLATGRTVWAAATTFARTNPGLVAGTVGGGSGAAGYYSTTPNPNIRDAGIATGMGAMQGVYCGLCARCWDILCRGWDWYFHDTVAKNRNGLRSQQIIQLFLNLLEQPWWWWCHGADWNVSHLATASFSSYYRLSDNDCGICCWAQLGFKK
ncbi:MAG: RHS repeat-associated core domain-containing protein [Nitrosomonadales bacterium]|nr:RHS repeat-associated core domain-containing protein [Nitrosomonadales bacterium]